MTVLAQVYCTVNELVTDLKLNGEEPGLLDRIRTACRHFANLEGNFIPVVQKRNFYPKSFGPHVRERRYYLNSFKVQIDPLIAAEEVLNAGVAVATADYKLTPDNRCWLNGPYTQLESDIWEWSELGVEITGYWGKYEEIRQVSVSDVSQESGATTLVVSDGSRLSPGMVMLIDHEQELVTAGNGGEDSPAATAATSLLNGAITADEEEMTVDNGAEFKRGEVIQISTEDLHIERIAGNVLVCKRGWNGSTKSGHTDDAAIGVYRTFNVERAVNGTPAEAHLTVEVWRYWAPEDVNWICRQVAGLMRMKAAVGFASKSGNADLGEVFYFNEFPNQIQKIRENYKVWWD